MQSSNTQSALDLRSGPPSPLTGGRGVSMDIRPGELGWRDIRSHALPGLASAPATRFWVRVFMLLVRSRVAGIRGIENVLPARGPFILVANHSQRLEALMLPAILAWYRGGALVHFFTDWLVMLYPVIGRVVMLHDPIVVTAKKARLAWFNRFKKRYEGGPPPFEKAAHLLAGGAPVALFPEGTMNRDRQRLLKGFYGAAQLSIETGMPVVPVGIRFDLGPSAGAIRDLERMRIEFGSPIHPPNNPGRPKANVAEIRDWHAHIMQAISILSGKQWSPDNQRKRYVT